MKLRTEKQRIRHNQLAKEYRIRNRDKVLAGLKRWQAANKDHIKEYAKKRNLAKTEEQIEKDRIKDRLYKAIYRKKNRELYNARLRKWSAENPEKVKTRNYKWAKNNREKVLAAKARRRAKSGNNPFTANDILHIRKLQNKKCIYCHAKLTPAIEHIDHIVALANGGTNDKTNIQLLCSHCNKRKACRDHIKFAQSMGQLL